MAREIGSDRRIGDRRVRQVYHDLERRSASDRRTVAPAKVVSEEHDRPGPIFWFAIVAATLLVTDIALWNGFYHHAAYRSLIAEGTAIRDWSDRVWRPAAA